MKRSRPLAILLRNSAAEQERDLVARHRAVLSEPALVMEAKTLSNFGIRSGNRVRGVGPVLA
jgi:hypothetical protein